MKTAIETFRASRWNERPHEGEWSANEVAAHLADASHGVANGIVTAIDRGSRPGRDPRRHSHTEESRGPAEWRKLIDADREALFGRLATVKGDEHLDIVLGHPMFGELNWREWLLADP